MTAFAHADPRLPQLIKTGEGRLGAEQIYPRLFDAILEQRLPLAAPCPSRRWAMLSASAAP